MKLSKILWIAFIIYAIAVLTIIGIDINEPTQSTKVMDRVISFLSLVFLYALIYYHNSQPVNRDE